MTRTMRRLSAVTAATLTVLTLGSGVASAATVDPERTGIDLWTSATFDPYAQTLTITADGEFRTTNAANTTLALQVTGTETWVDDSGIQHVQALTASPVSVQFARTNHVEAVFSLHPDSVVAVSYRAEDAGLAPSPFTGSCQGAAARTSDVNQLTTKDC